MDYTPCRRYLEIEILGRAQNVRRARQSEFDPSMSSCSGRIESGPQSATPDDHARLAEALRELVDWPDGNAAAQCRPADIRNLN
jgi:hypothetical protein